MVLSYGAIQSIHNDSIKLKECNEIFHGMQ